MVGGAGWQNRFRVRGNISPKASPPPRLVSTFVFTFAFYFFSAPAWGVNYTVSPDNPTTPTTPVIQLVSPEEAQGQEVLEEKEVVGDGGDEEEIKVQTILVEVTLELGTGDRLQGAIAAPAEVQFTHHKNGLSYVKTVAPTELKSVRILSYRVKHRRELESGTFYEFEPSEIQITLTNKKSYMVDEIPLFLSQIKITTEDGSTILYTFFGDSFYGEGGWEEVESMDPEYHAANPHPQAVRVITFSGPSP